MIHTFRYLLACDFEWGEWLGPCYSEFASLQAGCFQCYYPLRFPRVRARILYSFHQGCGRYNGFFYFVWIFFWIL